MEDSFSGFDPQHTYDTRVLPSLGARTGGIAAPRWVLLGGQQGSGKTTLQRRLLQELGEDKTQVISGDALTAFLPPRPIDQAASENWKQASRKPLMDWTEQLIARACAIGANVVWEQPNPSYAIEFAEIARVMGFQTEAQVLALPAIESWLAALGRDLSLSGTARLVPWPHLLEAYHRWPAFLALAEDRVAFDRISVLNRDGEVYFTNRSRLIDGQRHWEGPAFAFESLIVERNQARSPAAIAKLVSDWEMVRTHPDLSPRAQPDWSKEALQDFATALASLGDDPSTGFDLNQPDPALAKAWLARLKADLAATGASRDARDQKALPARGDRLLSLVAQVAGQSHP